MELISSRHYILSLHPLIASDPDPRGSLYLKSLLSCRTTGAAVIIGSTNILKGSIFHPFVFNGDGTGEFEVMFLDKNAAILPVPLALLTCGGIIVYQR